MLQKVQGKNSTSHIFGDYVMNTTGNAFLEDIKKNKMNKDDRMIKLFEMIEDYIEQA